MALVRRYFEGIPRREVPAWDGGPLPEQTSERTETMVDPLAELAAFHIAYHIPPSRTPDHYPLELLALVLGDGESSRLYQKLVKERELLNEISVNTDDRRGPDLFSFWGVVSEGKSAAEARQIIFDELAKVARESVTVRELEKAKNRVRAYFVFGLQSNLQRAMQLAEYELYWGDAELLRTELSRYLSVTRDDIRRVAGRYFEATNRTVLDVVPPPRQGQAPEPHAAAGRRGRTAGGAR
jgi:predicted Zn-dependent peptidase